MVSDAKGLIKFLTEALGAELSRGEPKVDENGRVIHAELVIGDSVVMMGEPDGKFGAQPATLYTYVDDCDVRIAKAIECGATLVLEPDGYPQNGDRYGGVKDICGNIWWLVTHYSNGNVSTGD